MFDRDVESLRSRPQSFEAVGIRPVALEFPVLILALLWRAQDREFFLHVEADNYDYLPVRGWWVDEHDVPLRRGSGKIPTGNGLQASTTPYAEDRSWFCFRGWREYHDHQSHQDVPWPSIRDQKRYRIPGIIIQLHSDLNGSGISLA